jgi:two-component system, chemotaxis family, CheB/CheR fusion protein
MSETPILSQANRKPNEFLIVGIGASAGGIQALKKFFENVPATSGMAYVVILHLSPDYDSKLAEVLQTVALIPVTQVIEKILVEPDHIYVVSPNQHLEMMDGSLIVTPNISVEERRAPVDIFFRTLAESHGTLAVAVILSGSGANGSMGLKRIKERGGATFVQNPREAEFGEMPRNAIATELVDDVLPVAEIPAKIIAYKQNLGAVVIHVEAESRPEIQQQALRAIFTQLRLRTGHDFSNYKRPTLLRRIERRINIHHLPDLTSYAAYCQQQPEETQALLKDLLISVTNFFRDGRAFEVIERDILPHLLHGKRAGDALRIWIAGCATGEEAYSLAMLCAERTIGVSDAPKVQIFATDIDEHAIATAREGLYTINDAADVSPERLRRFFTKEGEMYRIRRELREMVLFAVHNVIKDPPFSRLDLVSCRNMLIYLNQTAQERVMETLHFALNPGGYLFLGMSESVDGAGDLYVPVSREYHIFQSRQVAARAYPVPEGVLSFRLDKGRAAELLDNEKRAQARFTYGDLHQRLLEQYAPPSVVINEEYDIVHLTERAGRYLQVAGGEPSQNLLKLIRPELRLELRTALYQATQRQTNVEARNLKFRINGHTEAVNIHIRPVLREGDTARGFMLVIFEPNVSATSDEEKVFTSDEPMARQLEEELMRLKAQLRTTNEHHEVQAEELKASNEELQAMNEELRSAAEELETSREELQSINEELTTVNQELKVKIEEATLTSNNLQNLINSTDIGTIFLDRSFRVNLFTERVRSFL